MLRSILRLLGSSDDKEKIGVARAEGPPLRGFRRYFGAEGNRSQVSLQAPVEPTVQERASVHWPSFVPETMSSAQEKFLQHRFNRWGIGAYHRCNDVSVQGKIPSAPVEPTVQEKGIGALAVLCTRDDVKCPEEVSSAPVQPTVHRCIPPV